MEKTKCNCGKNNKITCPTCSKIKMVILLNVKYRHLKKNGANPVWYSHLSKNRKSANVLMNAMERRFLNSEYKNKANCLIFYDNATKEELKKVML